MNKKRDKGEDIRKGDKENRKEQGNDIRRKGEDKKKGRDEER